jgi:type VI secretion system lysozyme-like protein
MKGAERIIRRSVLDRLLQNGEPEPRSEAESVRAFKSAVMRDVESLLNSRQIIDLAPSGLSELQESVYHYGLADITSVSADSLSSRRELLKRVEQCVERFEPRLTAVSVSEAVAEAGKSGRTIRFRVEAMLKMDEPEAIFFETVLDPGSGRFAVPGSQ